MEAIVRRAISDEIRHILRVRKISQQALADGIFTSRGMISCRLNGKRQWSLSCLQATAAFFGMPLSDLIRRAEWRAEQALTQRQTG